MSWPVCPIQMAKASPSARAPWKLTLHHGGQAGSGMATLLQKPRTRPSRWRIRSAAQAMKSGSTGTVASSINFRHSLDIIHHWQTLIPCFWGGDG